MFTDDEVVRPASKVLDLSSHGMDRSNSEMRWKYRREFSDLYDD